MGTGCIFDSIVSVQEGIGLVQIRECPLNGAVFFVLLSDYSWFLISCHNLAFRLHIVDGFCITDKLLSFSFAYPSLFLRSLNSEPYLEYKVSIWFNKHLPSLSDSSVSQHTVSPLPHPQKSSLHLHFQTVMQFYHDRDVKVWVVLIYRAWNILNIMDYPLYSIL